MSNISPGFVALQFANAQTQADQVIRHYRGDFYDHRRTSYSVVEKAAVAQAVQQFVLAQKFELPEIYSFRETSQKFVDEVVGSLAMLWHLDGHEHVPFFIGGGPENFLAMANGILNLDPIAAGTGDPVLMPLTPDLFCLGATAYGYDVSAPPPEKFIAFLDWFTCGDGAVAELILQALGYTLLLGRQEQVFFWFHGSGNNGKGVLFKLLEQLVGAANVGRQTLEQITSQFGKYELVGKYANISYDQNDLSDRVAEGSLKGVSSGDPFTVDRKYKDPMPAVFKGKLWFSSNPRPKFRDTSDGIWRRFYPFACNAKVADRVLDYDKQLAAELPAILNNALAAAQRLVAQGGFRRPPAVQRELDECRMDTNSARRFLHEQYRPGSHEPRKERGVEVYDFTPTREIYGQYREWCKRRGYLPYADNSFGVEIPKVFPGVERQRERGKGLHYRPWGYCLVPTDDFDGYSPESQLDRQANRLLSTEHRVADVERRLGEVAGEALGRAKEAAKNAKVKANEAATERDERLDPENSRLRIVIKELGLDDEFDFGLAEEFDLAAHQAVIRERFIESGGSAEWFDHRERRSEFRAKVAAWLSALRAQEKQTEADEKQAAMQEHVEAMRADADARDERLRQNPDPEFMAGLGLDISPSDLADEKTEEQSP